MSSLAISDRSRQPVDPFAYAADLLDPAPDPFADDPVGWISDRLDETTWSKQREIMESVRDNRRTAVKSCHNIGKSHIASRAACWWLDTHPLGDTFVVTTAPSFPQVRAILWRYIGQAHRKGDLTGRVNQTEWWMGEEMVAYGRKPADYDEVAFQGIHATYVLLIIDEAGGVPESLWTAAGSIVSNEGCRVLAIGNPDDPSSRFADVCQPGSGYNVISVAASQSPNFTGESVPLALSKKLISQLYLDDLTADGCGPGTPIWTAKVDAEFPIDSETKVVRISKLAKCRIDQEYEGADLLPVKLGVDVGGSETGDFTVIRERRGRKAGRTWRIQSSDSDVVAAFIRDAIVEADATVVNIDSIGIGWGVAGHLNAKREAGEHSAQIVKVNVGKASSRPERYPRLRDEIWWEVGRLNCERSTWDLSEIDDRTAGDLLAPEYTIDASGRIKVEPKEDTRKRLGRSPDDGDALLLAFYEGASQDFLFEEGESTEALDGTELYVQRGTMAVRREDAGPIDPRLEDGTRRGATKESPWRRG